MKAQKFLLIFAALLLGGIGSAVAGGRVHGSVGIYVSPGPYWGPAYPRPYYYPRHYYPRPYYPGPYLYSDPFFTPAPVVVVPSAPPVYIEQNNAAAEPAPDTNQYCYYCGGTNQ